MACGACHVSDSTSRRNHHQERAREGSTYHDVHGTSNDDALRMPLILESFGSSDAGEDVALRGDQPELSLLSTATTLSPPPDCCPVSFALLSWQPHSLCLPSSCVCSCTVARSGNNIYPHLLSVPPSRLSFCPVA